MLLFDFDGVIADSLEIYANICAQAARKLGYHGPLSKTPFAELDHISFEALAQQLGLCPGTFTSEACRLFDQRHAVAPLFDGMAETVTLLAKEHPLGILSASPAGFIERCLRKHGLDGAFSLVLTRDDTGTKAQKIAAVQHEGRHIPLALIGDGVSDIRAATDTGLLPVGVSWGWQSPDRLLQAGAGFVAKSPAELRTILSRLPQTPGWRAGEFQRRQRML